MGEGHMGDLADLERLRDALRVERDCCASLADVLRAERAAAYGHELDALLGALREREAIQARWEAAARRRGELLASGVASPAAGDAGAEIAVLRAELAAEASELRRQQGVNEAVLRGALDGVNELLAAIRQHLPGARYDGRARMTAPVEAISHAGWRA